MKWIITMFALALIYALVRYVAFDPKNAAHIPVFIINKGVAMAALLCFVAAFIQQLRQLSGTRIITDPGLWFRAGIFGAIWHIPMALAILKPAYFKEFFEAAPDGGIASGRMTTFGELIFFFGGLTTACFFLLMRQTWTASQRWWLSLAAMLVSLGHVLAMGWCRAMKSGSFSLNIDRAHAYLPPMWLLSAIGVLIGIMALVLSKPRSSDTNSPR